MHGVLIIVALLVSEHTVSHTRIGDAISALPYTFLHPYLRQTESSVRFQVIDISRLMPENETVGGQPLLLTPRRELARLIRALIPFGPQVIALDLDLAPFEVGGSPVDTEMLSAAIQEAHNANIETVLGFYRSLAWPKSEWIGVPNVQHVSALAWPTLTGIGIYELQLPGGRVLSMGAAVATLLQRRHEMIDTGLAIQSSKPNVLWEVEFSKIRGLGFFVDFDGIGDLEKSRLILPDDRAQIDLWLQQQVKDAFERQGVHPLHDSVVWIGDGATIGDAAESGDRVVSPNGLVRGVYAQACATQTLLEPVRRIQGTQELILTAVFSMMGLAIFIGLTPVPHSSFAGRALLTLLLISMELATAWALAKFLRTIWSGVPWAIAFLPLHLVLEAALSFDREKFGQAWNALREAIKKLVEAFFNPGLILAACFQVAAEEAWIISSTGKVELVRGTNIMAVKLADGASRSISGIDRILLQPGATVQFRGRGIDLTLSNFESTNSTRVQISVEAAEILRLLDGMAGKPSSTSSNVPVLPSRPLPRRPPPPGMTRAGRMASLWPGNSLKETEGDSNRDLVAQGGNRK